MADYIYDSFSYKECNDKICSSDKSELHVKSLEGVTKDKNCYLVFVSDIIRKYKAELMYNIKALKNVEFYTNDRIYIIAIDTDIYKNNIDLINQIAHNFYKDNNLDNTFIKDKNIVVMPKKFVSKYDDKLELLP